MPKPTTTHPRRLLSIDQAAEYLGVTERSVRAYVARGDLKASRIRGSRLVRIDQADLDAMLRPIPSAKVGA